MSLKIRKVSTLDDFRSLGPVWSELANESGQTSPFLSHEWFQCCWTAAGSDRQPELLLIEDTAGPLAAIPLMRWREKVHGLPVRLLGLAECPDTPFADLLIAGQHDQVLNTFLQYVRTQGDWDLMRLRKIPTTSPTVKLFQTHLERQGRWRAVPGEQSPYLEITGGWSEFFSEKTQRFRKTLRNIQNRLERAGRISVEEHREVDPDSPLFSEILEVSSQSWKADRGVAMATMPRMPEFFRDLSRCASRNGWLRLWMLRLNGHAVATEYQIQSLGVVHALRSDYAWGVREYSPGAYLNFRIIQSLFEAGDVTRYDMGPGTNEYKLRWASGSQETITIEIYRDSLYGRFLNAFETKAVPLARQWRDRTRSGDPQEAHA